MRLTLCFLVLVLAFVSINAQTTEKPPITNEDVVLLVKRKASDSLIFEQIRASTPKFDLSAKGVAHLLENRVPESVISAMRSAGTSVSGTSEKSLGVTSTTTSSPPASSAKIQSVTTNDFVIDLLSCSANQGTTINCNLKIKNVADVERKFRMLYNTYMRDESSRDTRASEQFVGSKYAGRGLYDKNKLYGKTDGSLKAGETTTATVVFQKLTNKPKVIQLNVALSSNFDSFSAEFADVPVK